MDLKKEGRTIFINTHNLDDAERLCDTVGVMKTRLLAYGSPEQLSREFWGRTTVVHLRSVTAPMVDAVRGLDGVVGVKQLDNKLMIDVADPGAANPGIIAALVRAGGEVEYVNELKRTLEDVYVRLLGDRQ
jgi:ABC-2 type transport system ATP-binding protein